MRLKRIWYRIVWVITSALFRAVCRVETDGRSNVPERGPLIIASNHLHLFDPPLVLAALPFREITVLAAEKWAETWPISWLLKSMGAIFVVRGEVDREAIKKCLAVLEQGGILGLAPEGTRSRSGTMQRGKPGVAYLATRMDVPILPVGISGQKQIFGEWKRLRRPRVLVRIGQPFKLPPVHGQQKSEQLQEHSDQVMRRIAALVDEDLRGVYADAVREAGSTA
ncbi:MAG: lysophospholipid acyltransferase family protein [Anaerolineae bacterium]